MGNSALYDQNEENIYRNQFKPVLDPRLTEINISFTTCKDFVEHYKSLQLNLSKNRDEVTYNCWQVNDVSEFISYTMGVYKNDSFDSTFSVIKQLNPELTDINLYNSSEKLGLKLVDHKPYCGDNNCIYTYSSSRQINVDKVKMTLKILLSDLQDNLPVIKTLLII